MSDVLRIGMIGCGGNGRGHLKALSAHPESRIAAMVDPAKAMIDRARREIPALAEAPAFADHRAMLKAVELDAVAISTPHTQHTRQILDALNAGLHVLCEKPLTCSVADTKKVIAMFVQSFLSQGWLRGTRGTWRQEPELAGGGQLNDSGSHLVDMIFWTMPSRPVEVSAMIENRGAKVDIDSAISFRFADGCLGNLSILGAGPRNVFWEDLTIAGSGGQALFLRNGQLTVSTGTEMVEYKSFGWNGDKHAHFIDVGRGQGPGEERVPARGVPAQHRLHRGLLEIRRRRQAGEDRVLTAGPQRRRERRGTS